MYLLCYGRHLWHGPYSCLFPPEMNDVTINPNPNPAIMQPTNAKADALRKKNPIPRPRSKPPPIAHVLLSSFPCFMQSSFFFQTLYPRASFPPRFLRSDWSEGYPVMDPSNDLSTHFIRHQEAFSSSLVVPESSCFMNDTLTFCQNHRLAEKEFRPFNISESYIFRQPHRLFKRRF
jgi:hypothetical protein